MNTAVAVSAPWRGCLVNVQTQRAQFLSDFRSAGHSGFAHLLKSSGGLATSGWLISVRLFSVHATFFGDTACASPVACKVLQMAANKFAHSRSRLLFAGHFDSRCNYARGAMQMVYQGLNIVAQVLGVLVSLLCGAYLA